MTEHRVIRADFSDFRRVKGRKVLQLFLEIPLEEAERVLSILGHPKVGESTWCAVALLNENVDSDTCRSVSDKDPRSVSGSAVLPAPSGVPLQAEGGFPKKHWSEYPRSQQAGILCSDPEFQRYFKADNESVARLALLDLFRIHTRKDLDIPENHARWDEFVALYHLDRQRYSGSAR